MLPSVKYVNSAYVALLRNKVIYIKTNLFQSLNILQMLNALNMFSHYVLKAH
jgi:hypothetical protein